MHAGAETHFLALTQNPVLSQKETSSVYTLLSKYTIRCYNLQKKNEAFLKYLHHYFKGYVLHVCY